jgi:hypothetical protein
VSSQAQGSAITYATRYAFMAVTGIAPADDDGAAATAEWHPPADPRKHRVIRERRTAAEDTDWTTEPAADDTPGTITDEQLATIQDYWISLGIDAEDRRALVIAGVDRAVRRIRDLSKTEGDKLISYLRDQEQASEGGA